jgi:hypothetical protein
MPLDNCICRDRRQPATASYLASTLASLLVRKEGKCCYVLTTSPSILKCYSEYSSVKIEPWRLSCLSCFEVDSARAGT